MHRDGRGGQVTHTATGNRHEQMIAARHVGRVAGARRRLRVGCQRLHVTHPSASHPLLSRYYGPHRPARHQGGHRHARTCGQASSGRRSGQRTCITVDTSCAAASQDIAATSHNPLYRTQIRTRGTAEEGSAARPGDPTLCASGTPRGRPASTARSPPSRNGQAEKNAAARTGPRAQRIAPSRRARGRTPSSGGLPRRQPSRPSPVWASRASRRAYPFPTATGYGLRYRNA
jgi:hypothetical protein